MILLKTLLSLFPSDHTYGRAQSRPLTRQRQLEDAGPPGARN
jgi:hypothetical protein